MKYKLNEIKNNKSILEKENINSDIFFKILEKSKKFDFKEEDIVISFVIPSHNRYEMLIQCINSIFMQKYKNFEIIVIDDSSTQNEYKSLKNMPINYIRNTTSLGPGKSRQKGYNIARGDYIIFIDDDDFYINDNFLNVAIEKLNKEKNLAFVSFNSITYYENNNEFLFTKINAKGSIKKEEYFINFVKKIQKPTSTFTTIFRKEHLKNADFSNMEMMNDSSIYLRALTQGDAFIFNNFIGAYRVHNSNISKSIPHSFILENIDEKINIFNIANKSFDTNLTPWLKNQMYDTLMYYVIDTKCSFKNALDFITYTSKKTKINILTLIYFYIKIKIIKVILSK